MKTSATIRCVLFDLDGTLIDTAPDLGGALNQLRVEEGHAPMPLEALRPYCSQGARGLIGVGFGIDAEDPRFPPLRDRFLALYSACLDQESKAFDGIDDMLSSFEQRGIAWGVVTNKPRRYAEPLMAALGYAPRMACLVAGDDTVNPKPAPDPLLAAGRATGIPAEASLYVGDDRRDITSARAAGMPVLGAGWGYIAADDDIHDWGADAVMDRPEQVTAHVLQRIAPGAP
jgi:2-phosphoglycolate phosphatase